MPVTRRQAPLPHSHPELARRLAEELRNPNAAPEPDLPEVTEEEQTFGRGLHVSVIWEQWKAVPREERGAVILDAYHRAGKEDVARRVTLALGLTADEAKSLGLKDQ